MLEYLSIDYTHPTGLYRKRDDDDDDDDDSNLDTRHKAREYARGKKRRMDGLCVSFFFSLGFFVAFLPTKNTTTRFDVVCSFLRVVPVRKRMCIVLCLPKAKRKTGD